MTKATIRDYVMTKATKWPGTGAPSLPAPSNRECQAPTFEYRLTTASSPGDLERQVAQAIEEGWRPQGGVAIDEYYDLVQALVRGD